MFSDVRKPGFLPRLSVRAFFYFSRHVFIWTGFQTIILHRLSCNFYNIVNVLKASVSTGLWLNMYGTSFGLQLNSLVFKLLSLAERNILKQLFNIIKVPCSVFSICGKETLPLQLRQPPTATRWTDLRLNPNQPFSSCVPENLTVCIKVKQKQCNQVILDYTSVIIFLGYNLACSSSFLLWEKMKVCLKWFIDNNFSKPISLWIYLFWGLDYQTITDKYAGVLSDHCPHIHSWDY